MKTTDYIQNRIERLPKGYVFTYKDFITEVNTKEAVIKGLNRMASAGKIAKLSKGRFYKPEGTVFGSLPPDQYQVVKDLLEKDGKLIGYITGYGIYNQLGLTTQVSNIIQIGRNEPRPALKRGVYRITFIKQKNKINKENIPLLQILDSIRYIKKIPDATLESSSTRLLGIIKKISVAEQAMLVRLGLKYSAATRALLGAFLEELGNDEQAVILKRSLNPITKYNFSISKSVLPSVKNWNIK